MWVFKKFFNQKKIKQHLQKLHDVGLGYITLGQTTSTLSGGETQRLKLASELNNHGNVYVLDEPATGLHSHDINKLYQLLNAFVENGNSVIVIEHRLELIGRADWIIDMGEEGGNKGGKVLFEGRPSQIIKTNTYTEKYLKKNMEKIYE